MSDNDLSIFDDLVGENSALTDDTNTDTDENDENETNEENENENENENSSTENSVETFSEIPEGALSVTDFAAYITQTLMRQKIMAGQDTDGSEYVVPQSVYQTVKAKGDRIPHILVKGEDDTEARVYIKKAEATEWWLNRKERLSTRGQGGSVRASSRTPEENLKLYADAIKKDLYANDRKALWVARCEQTENLVNKYLKLLSAGNVTKDQIDVITQEATDEYNKEKAQKEAEKKPRGRKPNKVAVEIYN